MSVRAQSSNRCLENVEKVGSHHRCRLSQEYPRCLRQVPFGCEQADERTNQKSAGHVDYERAQGKSVPYSFPDPMPTKFARRSAPQ